MGRMSGPPTILTMLPRPRRSCEVFLSPSQHRSKPSDERLEPRPTVPPPAPILEPRPPSSTPARIDAGPSRLPVGSRIAVDDGGRTVGCRRPARPLVSALPKRRRPQDLPHRPRRFRCLHRHSSVRRTSTPYGSSKKTSPPAGSTKSTSSSRRPSTWSVGGCPQRSGASLASGPPRATSAHDGIPTPNL